MAITKYIIDKSDLTALLSGENIAIQPNGNGNIKGFCVEITGNLTNGDMIKAMFNIGDDDIGEGLTTTHVYTNTRIVKGVSQEYDKIMFNREWWNAPLCREDGGDCQLSSVKTIDKKRPKDCPLFEIDKEESEGNE